jgi:hypothetical protein
MPETVFVGWYRAGPRGTWRPLVRARTATACLRLLEAATHGFAERIVLPQGQRPDRPEPAR